MALQATFTADFTKFNAAVKSAAENLKPIEVAAKGVNAQLERTAKAFSGVNLKREAEIAAAAVKSIGGATKLTTDELKRYEATITSAIAKSKKLGETISAEMREAQRDIAAAKSGLKGFGDIGGTIKSAFGGIGPAVAGAFAVGSIVAAGKAVLDYAGNIKDLANQTGFSTKAVQELKFAAEQSGTTFEAIANSSNKLQKALGEGKAGTVGALRELGLNLRDLKSMKPEEAFELVASKLGAVENQADQVRLGTALMGKGFQEVSKAINDDLDGNIKKAREWGLVMGDDQIAALDDLGDAVGALSTTGKVLLAEFLVPLTPALIDVANAVGKLPGLFRDFRDYVGESGIAAMKLLGILKFLAAQQLDLNPARLLDPEGFKKQADQLRAEARQLGADADAWAKEIAARQDKPMRDLIARAKQFGGEVRGAIDTGGGEIAGGFRAELKQAQADLNAFAAKSPEAFKDLRAAFEFGKASMEDLQAETGLSELALQLFQKQVQETNKALKESDAAKAAKGIEDLTDKLEGAHAAFFTQAETIEKFGSDIRKVIADARVAGVAIPASIEAWGRVLDQVDISKVRDQFHKLTEELGKAETAKFFTSLARDAEINTKRVSQTFDAFVKAHDEAEDEIAKRTKTATEYQIAQLEKARDAEIAALEASGPIRDKAEAEIRRKYDARIALAKHAGLAEAEANRLSLKDQLLKAEQTYRDMVAAKKFSNAEIKASEEDLRDAVAAIHAAFGKDWKKVLAQMGVDWRRFAGLVKGTSFGSRLASELGEGFKQALPDFAGILTDALLGNTSAEETARAIGGTVGAVLGKAIGVALGGELGGKIGEIVGGKLGAALADALYESDAEKAVKEVGREWGVTISEELAGQIEETMKSKFEGMKNNRWLAEVFNLGAIIDEVGLAADNISSLNSQLRNAFSFLEQGAFSAADVRKVLDESFDKFAEYYTSRNALISGQLQEIIKLDRQLGTESAAIADFVAAQAGRAAEGFNKIAKNFLTLVTGFAGASPDMENLLTGIDEAIKKHKPGKFAPEFLADVESELKKIGPLAEGAFGALLAGGASVTEAIAQMGPGLDQINKILEATGVHAQGFLGQVLGWQDVIERNKELFEVLSGVDDMLAGLHNSGLLTQESFSSLASTVTDAFNQLRGQGETAASAIALMQPELQTIWELQQDFGYAVDEATQALLDQAEAAGAVGDEHRSVEEQMLQATNAIKDAVEGLAHVFGVVLPSDIAAMVGASKSAVDGVNDNLARLPQDGVNVPINFPTGEMPQRPDLPDNIEVPVSYPAPPQVPIPDHPDQIEIPIDTPFISAEEWAKFEEWLRTHEGGETIPIDTPISDGERRTFDEWLAEHEPGIDIPIDFPIATPKLPPLPDGLEVPIDLPMPTAEEVEEFLDWLRDQGIEIPIDFPVTDPDMPTLPEDIEIPIGFDVEDPDLPRFPRKIQIPVDFTVERPEIPSGRPPSGQQYQHGTPGLAFVNFGHKTPADLHGWEAVVPWEKRAQAVAAWGFSKQAPPIINNTVDYRELASAFLSALHRSGLTALANGVGQRDALDRVMPNYLPEMMSRFGGATRQMKNTLGIR